MSGVKPDLQESPAEMSLGIYPDILVEEFFDTLRCSGRTESDIR